MALQLLAEMSYVGTSGSKNLGLMLSDINYQLTLTGTGAISATVILEVSNDKLSWLSDDQSLFLLSSTNTCSAGFISTAPWNYVRINVISILGTSAMVTATFSG